MSEFHRAARDGDRTALAFFIKDLGGGRIDETRAANGVQLFHYVCCWSAPDVVAWMLDAYKPNLELRELSYGETPLFWCRGSHPGALIKARLLLNAGAQIDAIRSGGNTPLSDGFTYCDYEWCGFLLERGAPFPRPEEIPLTSMREFVARYTRRERRCRKAAMALLAVGGRAGTLSRDLAGVFARALWRTRRREGWE